MQSPPEVPDYQHLIDEETFQFIHQTEQAYPPDATSLSIESQRSIYESMAQQFRQAIPSSVSKLDQAVEHPVDSSDPYRCMVRLYRHSQSAIEQQCSVQLIYLHGGGFVVGSLESHDDVCAEICAQTALTVTAVDYRLLPEHPHPAALNDCLSAINDNYSRHGQPVLLCGDSAGANLCAAAAHHLRGSDIIVTGQVLIYPGLGADMSSGSYIEHANAPLLTTEDVTYYARLRSANGADRRDPLIAPLCDSDFAGLPPSFIVTAECDPLSDDGQLYCDAIVAAGGQAVCIKEAGLVHGYLRARHSVARARKSFDRILNAITLLATVQALPDSDPT